MGSLPVTSETLRRWCATCGKATVSWFDAWHDERCSGCDPENPAFPGQGLRDEDDDEDDDDD